MVATTNVGPIALTACLAGLGGFAFSMLLTDPTQVDASVVFEREDEVPSLGPDQARSGLPENQALSLEVAQLKARLAALGESADREVVATTQMNSGPEREAIQKPDWSEGDLAMLDKLLAEFSSETFAEAKVRSVQDYELTDIASYLISEYTNAEMAFEALRIQRLLPGNEWDAASIAYKMQESGHTGLASQLYLEALAKTPDNSEWVRQLAELDPAGALAILEQANSDGHMLETLEGRMNLGRLMLANGDKEGALAMLNGGDLPFTDEAWNLLVSIDPKIAEAQMLAATKGEDPYGEHSLRYARHLAADGREAEALTALEAALLTNPNNRELLQNIANLSSERGLELWAQQTVLNPTNPENWSAYSDQLEGAGREGEALEASLRGFELSDSTYIPAIAMRLAPERALTIFQERADNSTNDELWGDLADSYWQAGNSAMALQAWSKAKELDPADSEWTGKLQSLKDGTDPLGDQGYIGGFDYGILGDFFFEDEPILQDWEG